MANPLLEFQSGNESSLDKAAISNGVVRVTKDTRSLFFDIDNTRIEITDFIQVSTRNDLDNILAPISKKFYYVKSENLFYKYINGWKVVGSVSDFINNNDILLDIEVTIPSSSTNYVSVSGNDNYKYYIDIAVNNIRESDYPNVTLLPENGIQTQTETLQFMLISLINTYDNYIRVYVSDKPTVDFKILLHSIQNRSL